MTFRHWSPATFFLKGKIEMTIQLYDTVALKVDLPEYGLTTGEVGAVVMTYDGTAYEVEFVDDDGMTYGLHTLRAETVVALHRQGQALRTTAAA